MLSHIKYPKGKGTTYKKRWAYLQKGGISIQTGHLLFKSQQNFLQGVMKSAAKLGIDNVDWQPGRGGCEGSSVCQIQVDALSDPGSNPTWGMFICYRNRYY